MPEAGAVAGVDVHRPSAGPDGRPFIALLLEDDRKRADALSALLSSLAQPDVRVIRMGSSMRSRLRLEHILIQVAAPESEMLLADNARRIARTIAERQGQETRVVLLIKQAETLHSKTLRSLQAMAPYFAQNGDPTLQVVFVGRPAFRALLVGKDLAPLREALGLQADVGIPEPEAAEALLMPEPGASSGDLASLSDLSDRVEPIEPEGGPSARQFRKATPPASDEREPRSSAALPDAGNGRMGRLEPKLAGRPMPLPEPSAAALAMAPDLASRRRRFLVRPLLLLTIFMLAIGTAYLGIHRVFYRSVPARPILSATLPAEPQPPPAPGPPAPSTPAVSIPGPSEPVPLAPTPAPPPASPDRATPSITVAPAPPSDPSAHSRRSLGASSGAGRDSGAPSEARRGAPSGEPFDHRPHDDSASAAPVAMPDPRIVIHVPAGSERAEALSAQLLGRLGSRPGSVEVRHVAETPNRPNIRYFHPEDEPLARQAAASMADTGLAWTLRDFSTFLPRPSRGTIEVWLPRQ